MRPTLLAAVLASCGAGRIGPGRPVIDVHIHYSHDTWSELPPPEAIKVLRAGGPAKAFVSSSSDDGTQMLLKAAPDLIVPVLRPYRRRGETGSWMRDPSVIAHVESRLKANTYAGIGEFHAYGADADAPVMRRMVQLAHERKIFLHAHSDADAVERIFKQNPEALVLWAHSGFEQVDKVRAMVTKHKTLWADLAFRSDQAPSGKLDADVAASCSSTSPTASWWAPTPIRPSAGTTWSSTPPTRASGWPSCRPSSPTTSPSATPSSSPRAPGAIGSVAQ